MADREADGGYWLRRAPGPRDVLVWVGHKVNLEAGLQQALSRLESKVADGDNLEWQPDVPCGHGLSRLVKCGVVVPQPYELPRAPGANDVLIWIGSEVEVEASLVEALKRLENHVAGGDDPWGRHHHCTGALRECGVILPPPGGSEK